MITAEVGSRGVLAMEGFRAQWNILIMVSRQKFRLFLIAVARNVILASQNIWCVRNWHNSTQLAQIDLYICNSLSLSLSTVYSIVLCIIV